jgi:hypothetical protein
VVIRARRVAKELDPGGAAGRKELWKDLYRGFIPYRGQRQPPVSGDGMAAAEQLQPSSGSGLGSHHPSLAHGAVDKQTPFASSDDLFRAIENRQWRTEEHVFG